VDATTCAVTVVDEGSEDTASSHSRTPSLGPTAVPTPDLTPQSPSHNVWLTEPASIDEPLLILDEHELQEQAAATIIQLRAELAEARVGSKGDRAEIEALESSTEALVSERTGLNTAMQSLERENTVLRLQLQDHHGIMAADWAQTLVFQERLRQEEAACERLQTEVAELQETTLAKSEEATLLQKDAARWRLLTDPGSLDDVNSDEINRALEVLSPAMTRLHAETVRRCRQARRQLDDELEQQLCVVCKDRKKAVLFVPCLHVCVCEECRGRLRPYRCPICKEPVQSFMGRVHY